MPGEMSRGRLVQRLITFYAVLAVIGVAVVIFVVDKGGSEKAQPAIAGGYTASTPSPCIGPVPKPVGGAPLPATAPAQAAATGPSFNVLQSGQFVNFTNNQGTLGGKLRLQREGAARQRAPPDRECQLRQRQVAEPRRDRGARSQGRDHGHARRAPVRRRAEVRPARPGRGRAAHPEQHPGHVRAVPGARRASAARSRFTAPAR